MKLNQMLSIPIVVILASAILMPVSPPRKLDYDSFCGLKEVVLAIRGMERIAGIESPGGFNRAVARIIRAARAAAGIDVAIGQETESQAANQIVPANLSSPLSSDSFIKFLCSIETLTLPFVSMNYPPPNPPPRWPVVC